ncbi:MAG: hypothetical protein Kow0069_10470 [Promethearchaeota archaeon]
MSLVLGIFLAVLSYTMLNVGFVLEKKGAAQLPNIEDTDVKSNLRNFATNKVWLVGFALTAIQWWIYLVALNYAPLSVVAPFMGVGMVVLTVFSHYYLGEQITRVEGVAIAVTVSGLVVVGASSVETGQALSLEEMPAVVFQPVGLVFVLSLTASIAGLVLITVRLRYKFADVLLGVASGFCAGIGNVFSKAIAPAFNDLLDSLAAFVFWAFLFLAGAGNFGSMILQNLGFQKGRAVVVGPVFSVMTIVLPTLAGVLVFNEWALLPLVNCVIQIAGIGVVSVGILVLSWFGASKEEKDVLSAENDANKVEN